MIPKFPRIPHLPWSPGGTRDDRRLESTDDFLGNRIVVTEKLDGSNVCLTRDAIYSRSHSGPPIHISFNLAKKLHAEIRLLIPENISVFGEWCYAIHSIEYVELPGPYPFFMFGYRMEDSGWWSTWEEMEELAEKLNVNTVPMLFDGVVMDSFQEFSESLARGKSIYGNEDREGIVIWPSAGMGNDEDFSQQMAKWVKEGHPKDPDEHWLYKPIRRQGII